MQLDLSLTMSRGSFSLQTVIFDVTAVCEMNLSQIVDRINDLSKFKFLVTW